MKRLISLLTLYGVLMIPGKASGQIQVGETTVPDKGQLRISMPANNANVKNDPRIEEISFGYVSDKVSSVIISYKKTDSVRFQLDLLESSMQQYTKGFDLEFEGDAIMFTQEYPNLVMPQVPNVSNQTIYRKPDSSMRFDIVAVKEYADSTIYRYRRGYEVRRISGYGLPPRPAGDLSDVAKKISDRFSGRNQGRIDSVLVYQAQVSYESGRSSFILSKRLFGDSSAFSEAAEEILQNETKWFPAIGSSTARPLHLVRLRIYVRLLPDGSVQVETPKMLYNWTGD